MDLLDLKPIADQLAETVNETVKTLAAELQATRAVFANSVTQVLAETEAVGRRLDRLIALLERLDGLTLSLGDGK